MQSILEKIPDVIALGEIFELLVTTTSLLPVV